MKNRMQAMTLTEIITVLGIMGILMVILLGTVKTKIIDRSTPKIKATLYTLQKVDEILLSKQRASGSWSYGDAQDVCEQIADTINLRSLTGCNVSGVNFIMANGTSISGFNGNWTSPSGTIKHPYKDITFDINNTKGPNTEGKDRFKVRIFKDEPIVMPLTLSLLNSTDTVKFKVMSYRTRQNSSYTEAYDLVQSDVSYGTAACTAGIADEFMKSKEKAEITNCVRNETACAKYFDCAIQIMDIPSSVTLFRGS